MGQYRLSNIYYTEFLNVVLLCFYSSSQGNYSSVADPSTVSLTFFARSNVSPDSN